MAKPHSTLFHVEPMPEWLSLAHCAAVAALKRGECTRLACETINRTLGVIEADELPRPTVSPYGSLGLTAVWSKDDRQVLLIAEDAGCVRWVRFAGGREAQIPVAYLKSPVVLARQNLTWLCGGTLFSTFTKSVLDDLAQGGRLL